MPASEIYKTLPPSKTWYKSVKLFSTHILTWNSLNIYKTLDTPYKVVGVGNWNPVSSIQYNLKYLCTAVDTALFSHKPEVLLYYKISLFCLLIISVSDKSSNEVPKFTVLFTIFLFNWISHIYQLAF